MKIKHIISCNQFDKHFIEKIFLKTEKIKNPVDKSNIFDSNNNFRKILANLFYEPSTRTSSSFYSAAVKLGLSVIPINEMKYSSVAKGETLEDTIRTMNCYADIIVLRHFEKGAAERAAKVSNIPIINAGDGDGEHPTQALLDLFTIYEKYKNNLEKIKVGFMGDLRWGRTVHSLSKLLNLYNIETHFIAPEYFQLPNEYRNKNNYFHEKLENVLPELDVLYVTRIQKERITEPNILNSYNDKEYIINLEKIEKSKNNLMIMHPLPRVNEIDHEIDNDPRAYYFKQMQNGLYVRMALIDSLIFLDF